MLWFILLSPFVAAVVMMLTSGRDGSAAQRLSVALASFIGVVTVAAALGPNAELQLPWFSLPGMDVQHYFALNWDGISSALVALVAVLTPLGLLAGKSICGDRLRECAAGMFALQGCLVGAFLANDIVLFYLFFEAMLIPTAVLLSLFGDGQRKQATMRFVIYTMAGSAMFLVAIWYLVTQLGTSYLPDLIANKDALPPESLPWLFFAVAFAFVVKTPLFPFHGWQVPVYTTCPAVVAVLLAGVMAKLGPYGFMRIVIPLFPDQADSYRWIFIILGIIGIVGGAAMALVQSDLKKILAYSSLSHLGLIVVGVFAFDQAANGGAVVQMVAHGLSASALFLLIGGLEQRTGSRSLQDFGGIVRHAPIMAVLFISATLAAVALPGTAAFVGEFLLLAGSFNGLAAVTSSTVVVIVVLLAGSGLILGAGYMLRVVQRVVYGPDGRLLPPEIGLAEGVAVAVLLLASLYVGVRPGLILDRLDTDTTAVVAETIPGSEEQLDAVQEAEIQPADGQQGAHQRTNLVTMRAQMPFGVKE